MKTKKQERERINDNKNIYNEQQKKKKEEQKLIKFHRLWFLIKICITKKRKRKNKNINLNY